MIIVINTDQIYLHGGIEKVMSTKVNYWANLSNVKVFIITTEQNANPPCYALDSKVELIDLGVNYNRALSYFSLINITKAFSHFIKQKKVLAKLDPDVIISPNYNFDHYWLPFIKAKAKLIKERHSSRYFEDEIRRTVSFFKKLKYKFEDWVDSLYNYIVVLNPDEKVYVRSGNAVVIPNPVEVSDKQASLVNKQAVAAGRFAPVKRFDDLIKAWSIVNSKFPDWNLHIYGEDYNGSKIVLKNLIVSLGLERVVLLRDVISDVPQKMLEYSMYVLSSETECFPTVLLEALSVGLPIVSYDAPNGPRHIITNGQDGILVPHKNIVALADIIIKLISEIDLRRTMGHQAIINSKRFEQDKVMKLWSNILSN